MHKLLPILLGGALGATLRYGFSGLVYRWAGEGFPWGTLAVNVAGCFVIGLLWALTERAPFAPGAALFVFTGILGGFTTFSTYGLETFNLLRDGDTLRALLNLAASNLLGLAAVALGFGAARLFLTLIGKPL